MSEEERLEIMRREIERFETERMDNPVACLSMDVVESGGKFTLMGTFSDGSAVPVHTNDSREGLLRNYERVILGVWGVESMEELDIKFSSEGW